MASNDRERQDLEPRSAARGDAARQGPRTGQPAAGGRALALLPENLAGSQGRPADEAPAGRPSPRIRADAGFLAQLLAVRTHAPSQRAKCRAAPEVGAAAYETGLGLLAGAPRRMRAIEA